MTESSWSLDELVKSKLDRVVAVETSDNSADVYLRNNDSVERLEMPFEPFFLLSAPDFLGNFSGDCQIRPLSGPGALSYLAKFADLKAYDTALKFLRDSTGGTGSVRGRSPWRVFSDPTQQFLSSAGIRLFRGMKFGELRRMQVDIETLLSEGYDFPNPERDGDAICLISMSDSTGWEKTLLLDGKSGGEAELLKSFAALLRERDPDVVEGHNIFRFDLPYIEARAKKFKVKLNLGRDGSAIHSRPSRISIAERTLSYKRYEIHGRHIVDTYHLVLLYDVSHRDLDEYGLKAVARHFGISPKDRTYVDASMISEIYRNDPETLLRYGLDDARETRALSALLSPSYFHQAQIVPYSFQNCISRGNATKIDALLCSAYLDAGASIPDPEGERSYAGALTEAFHSGVFKNVWHCDVRSLYPSIILAEKWRPSRDLLGVFPSFLEKLRCFRLRAKDAEKRSSSPAEKDFFNSMQTSFKIMINSFYGYLGFPQGTFNDYKMAESVTARGREILSGMVGFLEKIGAKVIEIDTDGVYFQPPAGKSPQELEKDLQDSLPPGIDVELDAQYRSMFCYKSKNYALLKEDGEISITGAALKSRGLEAFQRDYISELVRLMLEEDYSAVTPLKDRYVKMILERKMPLAKFAKSETLSDSLDSYRRKLADGSGRRSAAYELAIASGRDYRQGDQVFFYVTGNKKNVPVVGNSRLLRDAPEIRDENVAYYLAKLEDLHDKFAPKQSQAREMTELGFEI